MGVRIYRWLIGQKVVFVATTTTTAPEEQVPPRVTTFPKLFGPIVVVGSREPGGYRASEYLSTADCLRFCRHSSIVTFKVHAPVLESLRSASLRLSVPGDLISLTLSSARPMLFAGPLQERARGFFAQKSGRREGSLSGIDDNNRLFAPWCSRVHAAEVFAIVLLINWPVLITKMPRGLYIGLISVIE